MRIISIAFQKYQISTGKIQLRFFYFGLPKLSLSNLFFPLFFQLFFFLFFTAKMTPRRNKMKKFFPLLQIEQQNVTYTNKKDASNAFKKHKKTRRMRSKNTKRRVECVQKTQKDASSALKKHKKTHVERLEPENYAPVITYASKKVENHQKFSRLLRASDKTAGFMSFFRSNGAPIFLCKNSFLCVECCA